MSESILIGRGRQVSEMSREAWEQHLAQVPLHSGARLGFMTEEHRLVHHFVVRELPKIGEPISPELVADRLALPAQRVKSIFDDLEKHMTFICRNDEGMAVWAYPVTVQKTPHRLTFSSGEQIYAA